jgi:hypothetical protein
MHTSLRGRPKWAFVVEDGYNFVALLPRSETWWRPNQINKPVHYRGAVLNSGTFGAKGGKYTVNAAFQMNHSLAQRMHKDLLRVIPPKLHGTRVRYSKLPWGWPGFSMKFDTR